MKSFNKSYTYIKTNSVMLFKKYGSFSPLLLRTGPEVWLSPEVKYNGVLYQMFGTFLCSSEAVQM